MLVMPFKQSLCYKYKWYILVPGGVARVRKKQIIEDKFYYVR